MTAKGMRWPQVVWDRRGEPVALHDLREQPAVGRALAGGDHGVLQLLEVLRAEHPGRWRSRGPRRCP